VLSPLVSKLIDGWARALLNEEIVQSALAAKRWQRALQLMAVWLREAGPEEARAIDADYRVVMDGLGPCARTRPRR